MALLPAVGGSVAGDAAHGGVGEAALRRLAHGGVGKASAAKISALQRRRGERCGLCTMASARRRRSSRTACRQADVNHA